ncbi:sensor histidine kinase [Kitasatospora sp. NBC_01246]|uniref:sensor histidine kinase n=1 Tax=Kitasatospora sp. NBC_01246 TaxID=2903570 RepID=UPI003FA58EAD
MARVKWWRSPRWAAVGRAAFLAFLVWTAYQNGTATAGTRFGVPVLVAAAVCAVVLAVPRWRLSVAPVVVTVATAWWGWVVDPFLAVVLFDLAVARRTRTALVCAALALAGNLLGVQAGSIWTDRRWAATLTALLFGLVVGLWQGNRRRLLRTLADQVDHLRVEARLREDAARAAERSRIAAEMHDVLAHRLSLIALHTGVLATRSPDLPPRVAERLALLRSTSVEALSDLREVLGALRGPASEDGPDPLEPALKDVRDLVDQARAAGQDVTLTVDGDPSQAPTTHRLAAYRIVREGLTNARKHADGGRVAVRVGYRPPATLVEVTNDTGFPGPGASTGSGYGLVGLRERVTALGGHLDAGPAGAGAWRLVARLPHPTSSDRNGKRP